MKKLLTLLMIASTSVALAVTPTVNSRLDMVFKGPYNPASIYRQDKIFNINYTAAPVVFESANSNSYVLIVESSTPGVLPESAPSSWSRI